MNRYHVDARINRKRPTVLRDAVRRLGIDGDVFIKDYANFFDTLPFGSAADARSSIPLTLESFARLAWIDALVARLAAATERRPQEPRGERSAAHAQIQT